MRFGTPDYGCEVVCKVTVLVNNEDYRTFTGRTLEGLKRGVRAQFPTADLAFGEPIWVQR